MNEYIVLHVLAFIALSYKMIVYWQMVTSMIDGWKSTSNCDIPRRPEMRRE